MTYRIDSPLKENLVIEFPKDDDIVPTELIQTCTIDQYLQGTIKTLPNCPHLNGRNCPMVDRMSCKPIPECVICPPSDTFLTRIHGYQPHDDRCGVYPVAYDFYEVQGKTCFRHSSDIEAP